MSQKNETQDQESTLGKFNEILEKLGLGGSVMMMETVGSAEQARIDSEPLEGLHANLEASVNEIEPAVKTLLDLCEKSKTAILGLVQKTDGTRGGTELLSSVHVNGKLHPDFAGLLNNYGLLETPA